MPETIAPKVAAGRSDEAPSDDLSAEIARSIDRLPGDRVTCRRVGADCYRCNWWSAADGSNYDNPGMSGMVVTTHTVRQSRFLRATRTAEGLVYR
jgi:hypothetical protein